MSRSIDEMADEVGGDFPVDELPRSWVGIPKTSVLAAASNQLVQVGVLRSFRPDRLVLSAAAQALDINDIKIATTSMNVSSQPVPGNMFAPDSTCALLKLNETASPAVGIQLFVTNDTVATVVLKGAFVGPFIGG